MPRHKFSFALPLLALTLAVSCSKLSKPTDDAITTDIKARMYSEPMLKSASVDVNSKDGIVTLSGQVPDDAARLAAERIASQTTGVKQVIDSTTVTSPAAAQATTPAQAPSPEPQPARRERERPAKSKGKSSSQSGPADAGTNPVSAQQEPAPAAPAPAPAAPAAPAPPPPPQPVTVTVPAGAIVTVRTIDAIDSSTARTGQTFQGSLDAPIVVDDRVVVPKGLNCTLKLVNAASAGKFKGSSELTVSLDSFTYQGKTYALATSDVQQKGASRGKRSAATIGGGAVLGALIGGLAGGGKGAAIGAAAGGGAGTAVQAMTKGQQVKIPSETRLDFTLQNPVDISYIPGKRAHRSAEATGDQPPSSDQPPHP